RRRHREPVTGLDAVVDEVLELGTGEGVVEPSGERDAARVRVPRAGDLQLREQVDRGDEERLGPRRIRLHRLPEVDVADVFQEEPTGLAGATGLKRGHRKSLRPEPA